MPTRMLTNIPAEQVAGIVAAFESEGCTVETEEQPDGRFTIIADCPDPAGDGG